MSQTIAEKLKIKPESVLRPMNAPPDFKRNLGAPEGVRIDGVASDFDQLHWFVMNKAQLEKELPKVMKMLNPGSTIWVYFPKATSKIQTDLSRDKGWDSLLKRESKVAWIGLISFDDTWSAFGFRVKTEADKKKSAKPKEQKEIHKWINASKKEVRFPDDVSEAMKNNKKAAGFFESLSYTNRKEYIEWIVSAKREETRAERIDKSIEALNKGWKNPRNV